jgi:RHS repeat-associated protein
MTDAATGQQYLRARYYDPITGRFNRLDPFAGNNEDPQSLHKYLYVHADPIGGIDPTGMNYTPSQQIAVVGMASAFVGLVGLAVYQVRQQFGGIGQIGATMDAVDLTPTESAMVVAGVGDLYRRGKNKNLKVNKLYELLVEAPGNLKVKKAPLSEESAGMHVAIARGTLYIDEEAFVHGQNAVALVVFAEFQHDQNAPNYFPDDLDPAINDEFDAIRDLYKIHEQNLYIFGLRHPVPRTAGVP